MLLLLDVAAEGCMCMQSGHCMYFIFAGLHVIQCVMAPRCSQPACFHSDHKFEGHGIRSVLHASQRTCA